MTMSGAEQPELPGAEKSDELGWQPGGGLSQSERDMLHRAKAGEQGDLGDGPFDLTAMQAWGPERTVRAAVLRELLVAQRWPVHVKGVQMRGARISGRLDLEATTLRCLVRLEDCYFDDPEPFNLDYATVSLLTLTRCHLAGLSGDTLTVTKHLDLSCSTFTGALRLPGADIAGNLICSGTQLNGARSDGLALEADRMKVGGGVFLDGWTTADGTVQPFSAAGAVRLAATEIGGCLSCSGAQLSGGSTDGYALIGFGMKAGRGVFLDGGFTAAKAIDLTGADVTGNLSCRGGRPVEGH